jgi:methylamine---glutamate N-methyltransferase subunit A
LGGLLAKMLVQMSDRGPDSAGFAIYRNPVEEDSIKITLQVADGHEADWDTLLAKLGAQFDTQLASRVLGRHMVLIARQESGAILEWLADNAMHYRVTSWGKAIEIYKEKGHPPDVVSDLGSQKCPAATRWAIPAWPRKAR